MGEINFDIDIELVQHNGSEAGYMPANIINAVNVLHASVIGAWWYPYVRSITPKVSAFTGLAGLISSRYSVSANLHWP